MAHSSAFVSPSWMALVSCSNTSLRYTRDARPFHFRSSPRPQKCRATAHASLDASHSHKEMEPFVPASQETVAQVISKLKFNSDGLIPAIAQQHDTMQVLMMAWMNKDSIKETLETGRVCYYSRSRNALWRKGEQSGQVQMLSKFTYDCDADTILVVVDQLGVACHTGRQSCFYNQVGKDGLFVNSNVLIDPNQLYSKK